MHNERIPLQDDWWYRRAASILRIIALRGPIGVSKLRTRYGGKKNRGVRPERFRIASGNIIRKILQQLDSASLSKQAVIGVHKGRVITPSGQKLLDKCATDIFKNKPKAKPKAEEPKQEKQKEEKAEKPAAETLKAEKQETQEPKDKKTETPAEIKNTEIKKDAEPAKPETSEKNE